MTNSGTFTEDFRVPRGARHVPHLKSIELGLTSTSGSCLGKYVEVTGVPHGIYILETTVDPDQTIIESDESNNCSSVYVRLKNVDSPSREAELLGPGPLSRDGLVDSFASRREIQRERARLELF